MAGVEAKDDLLDRLVKNFDAWFDTTTDARTEALEARDYYDGVQWTGEELAVLKKRKQPPITDNKLKDKIDYMIGLEIAARTDPKAYPRTPQHEQDSEAITDALRYVGDAQDFTKTRSDVAENLFVEGMGGAEVIVKKVRDGIDVVIKRNRYERCYWDPHSSEKDFSDARYLGTFVWMDLEAAKEKWPDAREVWDVTAGEMARGGGSESDADRPSEFAHLDGSRQRLRVIQQYFLKGGTWHRATFVKCGWIEKPVPSEYLDEDGEPEHPYSWASAYVDKENRRYGVIRRWKSLQDEINHRRSKSLHLLNTKGVVVDDGAVQDVNKLRDELAKPDYVVEKTPGLELEITQNLDLSAGHAALLEQATEALAIVGPKAITNVTASQSGRAKQLDRQSDALELGRLFDHLRQFQKQTYRKVWHRIKQYWTEEKWVRVRDDDGAPKFVALNKGITAQEMLQLAQQHGLEIHPQLAQVAQLTPTKVMAKRNDVTSLDVDVVIDEMPDVITLQQEQFEVLASIADKRPEVPFDVLIDLSQLRSDVKKRVKERMAGADDPEALKAAADAKALQKRGVEAEVAEAEARAEKTREEATQTKIENAAGVAALAGMAEG